MSKQKTNSSAALNLSNHAIFLSSTATKSKRIHKIQSHFDSIYDLLTDEMKLIFIFINMPAYDGKAVLTCPARANIAQNTLGSNYHPIKVDLKTKKLISSPQFLALYEAAHSADKKGGRQPLLNKLDKHYSLIFKEKDRDYALGRVFNVSPRTIRNIRAGRSK